MNKIPLTLAILVIASGIPVNAYAWVDPLKACAATADQVSCNDAKGKYFDQADRDLSETWNERAEDPGWKKKYLKFQREWIKATNEKCTGMKGTAIFMCLGSEYEAQSKMIARNWN